MGRIIFVAVFVVVLVFAKDEIRAKTGGPASTVAGDPCSGKKLCSVVYVAPWCPACRAIEPQLKELVTRANSSKEYGMKIIVGREREPGDNERTAKQFGVNGVVDKDLTYFQRFGITQFPSFFVVDAEGKTVHEGDKAYYWPQQNL